MIINYAENHPNPRYYPIQANYVRKVIKIRSANFFPKIYLFLLLLLLLLLLLSYSCFLLAFTVFLSLGLFRGIKYWTILYHHGRHWNSLMSYGLRSQCGGSHCDSQER